MGTFNENSSSSVGAYMPLNNRYAWRLNCEEGSDYGVDPQDYKTRDAYHEALYRMKYKWREYCEDDSEFGLDPQWFELESDYEKALDSLKNHQYEDDEADFSTITDVEIKTAPEQKANAAASAESYPDDDLHVFIFCRVVEIDDERYYWTEDSTIKKGDSVVVPKADGTTSAGVVKTVEHHMKVMAPQSIEDTPKIVSNMSRQRLRLAAESKEYHFE